MHNFKELLVWQKARNFVKDIYTLTKNFPADEKFGLTQQIRRASISIPSNISEGHMRRSKKEYIQFLSIAQGSIAELETQLMNLAPSP